jgi:hypothetical protein
MVKSVITVGPPIYGGSPPPDTTKPNNASTRLSTQQLPCQTLNSKKGKCHLLKILSKPLWLL